MSKLQQSAIKEIAKEISNGNTCYIHRYTVKITTIDNSLEDPKMIEAQDKTLSLLERKIESYVKVEMPTIDDQLVMMRDFLEDLPDKSVRKQISNALNRENPVRNFTQAIESDMELNLHWKHFKIAEYQRWVSNIVIDAYNY